MHEADSKPCKVVVQAITSIGAQQDSGPNAAADWTFKAGSVSDSSCSSSSSSSISSVSSDSDFEYLESQRAPKGICKPERVTLDPAQASARSAESCPCIPLWFRLRAPGRFMPWKQQSARLLELVCFYQKGAQASLGNKRSVMLRSACPPSVL